jgi:glycine oxidase
MSLFSQAESSQAKSSQAKIAVVGAGLVGRLLTWRLLHEGHSVTLFEAGRFDKSSSAARTAAAMISPMSEVVASERAIYDMGLHSLALWPRWLEELNAATSLPVSYAAEGSVVVAHAHDLSELEQFYNDLSFHLKQDNNARWLSGAELHQLEPDLSHQFDCGLYLPGEAHLDNRQLLRSLIEAIETLGGECLEQYPLALDETEREQGILANFDLCIDARGLGAKSRRQPLRGVRGEVLWVETDEVRFSHPIRLMHPRYKLYVVPKPGGRFIIGATEIESEDRSPVSVQSMLELCSALYTLNPAFAEARIVELDSNLRPAFMDNMPRVETTRIMSDAGPKPLISINGLYRHGYLLAPKLVEDAMVQIAAWNQQTETAKVEL